MTENIKGNNFIATRGFYGTNSVSFKNIELEVTRYNHDYADPVTSFDWGNCEKASQLLAYAMLDTIATPTIARVYAHKFTQEVIQNLHDDEWKMEALEVAKWINKNTDYKIDISANNEDEKIEKEKRRIQREVEFQQLIEEKLQQRAQQNIIDNFCNELKIQKETLAKILDISLDTLKTWQHENKMPKLALKAMEFYKAGILFKEQNTKLKVESRKFQEELIKNQTDISLYKIEIKKYREFINTLDIPKLCNMYKKL